MGSETDSSQGSTDREDEADDRGRLPRPSSWDRRRVALGCLAVVAVVAVVALGVGPVGGWLASGGDGGNDVSSSTTTRPTATPAPSDGAANDSGGSPELTMRVRSVEACGTRCRSVTIALSNEGDAPARDVRVVTEITTGQRLVWEGRSDVGRLDAGETITRTRRVEVGYLDAARIEANDGQIRIETTIRSANDTQVFTERRDVS